MIFDLAIVLTWIAAIYRIWVLASQPRAIWRTSFSVSMLATAVAFTLYRFRLPIDQLVGVPNLAGLLAHVIFAVGAGFLLVYLQALRSQVISTQRVRAYLFTSVVVSVIMTMSWSAAPIHDHPLDDLLPLAEHPSVAIYCVTFWSYLACALALMARTCLARGRTFRREDLARSISLLLIGLSAAAAIPALLLWTASILVGYLTGREEQRLNALGDALLPWPVLLNAAGVLALLTVPYLSAVVTTWWRGRQLKPLWQAMIARYPQVHLELQPSGGPLSRLQTQMERAIIEIHDGLRIATVDVVDGDSPDTSLNALAAALRRPTAGDRHVAELLERVDTREADLRQMLDLARAFRAATP